VTMWQSSLERDFNAESHHGEGGKQIRWHVGAAVAVLTIALVASVTWARTTLFAGCCSWETLSLPIQDQHNSYAQNQHSEAGLGEGDASVGEELVGNQNSRQHKKPRMERRSDEAALTNERVRQLEMQVNLLHQSHRTLSDILKAQTKVMEMVSKQLHESKPAIPPEIVIKSEDKHRDGASALVKDPHAKFYRKHHYQRMAVRQEFETQFDHLQPRERERARFIAAYKVCVGKEPTERMIADALRNAWRPARRTNPQAIEENTTGQKQDDEAMELDDEAELRDWVRENGIDKVKEEINAPIDLDEWDTEKIVDPKLKKYKDTIDKLTAEGLLEEGRKKIRDKARQMFPSLRDNRTLQEIMEGKPPPKLF